MWKRSFVVLAIAVLMAPVCLAQLVPTQGVALSTAKVSWSGPDPADYVTKHTVYCGTESGVYPYTADVMMPLLEVPLADVVPGPGIYECVATATNVVGESGWSVATAPFAAIQNAPAAPQGVTIVTE